MNITWKHTMSAVTILLALIATAVSITAPCHADNAVIGAECQIANVTGPAVDLRGQVSITAGAGSYLAVWRDHRSGTNYDIYGTFVDAAGNPLGSESFLISCGTDGDPTPGSENHPSVAFNGTNFLVVWDAVSPVTLYSEIYGARVTTTGTVLDPNGFQISQGYADIQVLPCVASNGVDWEVVWQKGGGASLADIAGATVSGANRSITKRITVSATANSELTPTIASNGLSGTACRYFVAWEEQGTDSDVKGCRINYDGNKISDVTVSAAAGAQFAPSVTAGKDSAGNLGGWMVAWEDAPVADAGSLTDVRVTRITAAGAVQDAGGILVFNDYGKYYSDWNQYYSTPAVGWNGLSYQVVCRAALTNRRAWGRTVGYNAALGAANELTIGSSSQNGMSIAGGLGSNGGCVLAMEYTASSNIGGCYINQTGISAAEDTLSLAKQDQQQCAAAWDGYRQVVVWADKREGLQNSKIYAARVRPNGTVDDPQGVAVSASAYEQTQPAIAWDPVDSCYLVVWRQGTGYVGNYDIMGMRLSAGLAPIGTALTICSYDMDRANPAVAWNGSYFLVVWADNRPLDETWDIYGTRVSGAGVVMSTVYVTTAAGNQVTPSVVAGNSGNWLVAWQDTWAMTFEYAIGTTPGGTNTRTWTAVGAATEVTATSLSLVVGNTYYISVRATNRAGTKSAVGTSDGIQVVNPVAPAGLTMTASSVPTTPVVVDDGLTTTIKTSLHATWSGSYDLFGEPAIACKVVTSAGVAGTQKSVSTTSAGKAEPKVAYDNLNSRYLVIWSESSSSLHGTLVSSANPPVPGSDIAITTSPAVGYHPSLAWTGDKYVVVWEDRRNSATTKTDIYGTRIAAAGTVTDTGGGMLVSAATKAESGPLIAPVSSGQCLAYYSNLTSSMNRLRARTFWTVTPPPPEYSINDAKQLADGTQVTFAEVVVTAGNDQFSGKFYIEDRSKASGIKIVWSGSTVSESKLVTVSGAMATVDGERQLTATSVYIFTPLGVVPVPLGVQPVSMGGVAIGLVPGVGTFGPNNVGLLVKCWGRVQNAASGYFELKDPNGRVVQVNCPFTLPTNGMLYAVTGISSCEPVTGGYRSVLLVRKVGDLRSL